MFISITCSLYLLFDRSGTGYGSKYEYCGNLGKTNIIYNDNNLYVKEIKSQVSEIDKDTMYVDQ